MGKKTFDKDPESVYALNHSKCMLATLQNFRQNETFLDVTLICEGKSIKAHKLVLSSCSQFFKEVFSENPCEHPIVILRNFDFEDLKACLNFIYTGQLSVPKERLTSALKMAEDLNIRGLIPTKRNPAENYKKLYNEICGKPPSRKKRKRHRHNSSGSENQDCIKVSDSDPTIESDPINADLSESQEMDTASGCIKENLTDEKEIRPLVLHVGDSTSNEESTSKTELDGKDTDALNVMETSSLPKENIEAEIYEIETESVEISSTFDAYTDCPENYNLEYVPEKEQHNSQGDQNKEFAAASEGFEPQSPSFSLKSSDTQQSEEIKPPDEGKRFICSKCDSVFTSRINFMRHKSSSHKSVEKSPKKCDYCTFITEDMDSLKLHLASHTDNVPYKCDKCSEEFTSEDVYQKHLALHEVEDIALHGLSAMDNPDLFSTQNKHSGQNLEFRCSICFIKFSSKLRCQIHEKTCQGGS